MSKHQHKDNFHLANIFSSHEGILVINSMITSLLPSLIPSYLSLPSLIPLFSPSIHHFLTLSPPFPYSFLSSISFSSLPSTSHTFLTFLLLLFIIPPSLHPLPFLPSFYLSHFLHLHSSIHP